MMVQLPPPVHGAAMMNQRAVSSVRVNQEFSVDILPIQTARSIGDIDRLTVRKIFRFLSIAVRLLWRLMLQRPAVVYYTIPASGSAFVGGACLMLLIKLFALPHVLQMHSRGIVETAHRSSVRRLLCKWVFSRATVIVFTPRLASDVAQFVRMERVRYLPNGIEDPYPKTQSHGSVKSSGPVILFLSNLIESKGPFVLLDALAILKARGHSFQAIFAGSPWDVSAQSLGERVRSLDLCAEVRYAGPVYGDEKVRLFLAADILAFPTFYPLEGFPAVLLEAMAFGLAIVATNEASIPDILIDERTGLLVPKRQAPALAAALERFLVDPEFRNHMGRAARDDFLAKFQLSRFEDQLVRILQEAIDTSDSVGKNNSHYDASRASLH
jgi:glycosyltransferase involved in cell wall biosynthesis